MNVSGSHRNFDDLDIEGYSEWNAGDEDFYSKKVKVFMSPIFLLTSELLAKLYRLGKYLISFL